MREIKFNVVYKHKTTKKVFTKSFTLEEIIGSEHIDEICDCPIMKKYYIEAFRQYSGLKDKNKKEIYEGDIVKAERYDMQEATSIMAYNGIIAFNNGEFKHDSKEYGHQSIIGIVNCEVLGNIYENKDLLNAK